MPSRARARELAAEYLAKGDPTGWFEQLYREAELGQTDVPWADLRRNPSLLKFSGAGKTALKIGCGLGVDAEQLAAWEFRTTAFDVSESAIRRCKQRFGSSSVHYVVADLLRPLRSGPASSTSSWSPTRCRFFRLLCAREPWNIPRNSCAKAVCCS